MKRAYFVYAALLHRQAVSLDVADDDLRSVITSLVSELSEVREELEQQRGELQRQYSDMQLQYNDLQREYRALADHHSKVGHEQNNVREIKKATEANTGGRRALTPATCNGASPNTTRARLTVEGVCVCTEDMVVAGHSVTGQLRQFNTSLVALEQQRSNGSATNSGGNCAQKSGACLTTLKSAFEDSTNMYGPTQIALDVDAGLAYVCSWYGDSVAVLDVGDPSDPAVLGVLQDSTNLNGASSVALDVDAGLLYVTSLYSNGLAVIDVGTDPTNPALVGVLQDSTNMNYAVDVALDADAGLAYVVASYSHSLSIVDVGTDPSNPTMVGVWTDSTRRYSPKTVALDVSAGLAYIAAPGSDYGAKFAVIDVGTDPSNPALASVQDVPGASSVALDVNRGLAYVSRFGGLQVFDVLSDPTSPKLLAEVKDTNFISSVADVQLDTDAGVAVLASSDELAFVDVGTDPANPTFMGVFTDSTNFADGTRVTLDIGAGLAYVACTNSDIIVIVAWKAMTWCAQGISSASRGNGTMWL
eukprot:INCI18086.1.p1 GENE.INCI18086.1~~INCI18086.1.p1  ORF type:complete len:531 (-),score=88.32 INCI18086.1:229-1821(-)